MTTHAFKPHPDRGFLPCEDPAHRLPDAYGAWDEAGADLPKWLAAGNVRSWLRSLPELDPTGIPDGPLLERAMLLLSYCGHAWVWGEQPAAYRLPAVLARPWHAVASRLQRPPVLSYASYALHNWRRLDPQGPVALGNLALLQNFLGGLDEEWFVLVHVEIEARAAPALAAVAAIQDGVRRTQPDHVREGLTAMASALDAVNDTMARMPEGCDPHVYFHRVRPYIHGWKNHPAFPAGLVYEGVEAFVGKPQRFAGETGAQSGIVPVLDAVLGIEHADDPLREYLQDMRNYMPFEHRSWLEQVEAGPDLRGFLIERKEADLLELYDRCVEGLETFRSAHLGYAARYIHEQSARSETNPSQVGTGGTPFMPYLSKHRNETTSARLLRRLP